MDKISGDIEQLVYCQLKEHATAVKTWGHLYGVDPRALAAILIVERQQYNLQDLRTALKRRTNSIFDYLEKNHPGQNGDRWAGITCWANNSSRGFSRIKYKTAQRALHLQGANAAPITPPDLVAYRTNPDTAIKIAAGILRIHLNQWRSAAGELSVEVLATLYNISDFTNHRPHPNPQPGGSVLPAVIDGEYITGLHFGERVGRVYRSKTMQDFIRTIWL